ncbi:NAD(P)/FAD-dependent oxidoreductase [Pontibaca methylaminivorans]|uniref:NAD(P)/FAD-dependent oxidoreductase n=1 Tax=Pontibaca methylaminivorans TaxID=515897 RepID=UPI002FDA46A4
MTESPDSQDCDIIVVGAGMAGASVAAELADAGLRVALLERESQPGYHSTGRSAALYSQTYGPPLIRALTRASSAWLNEPQPGATPAPFLHPRDVIYIARADQTGALDALQRTLGPAVAPMAVTELESRVPLLRPGHVAAALAEASAADIDVHALHQFYLRRFRAAGGTLHGNAGVIGLARSGGRWRADTARGVFSAPVVVNAAGAWADELATMAGVRRIGLVPRRRTAVLVEPPRGCDVSGWPMIIDAEEQFYTKPEAGQLLISPADETPCPPCDAQPEELDVAIAIDRFQAAFAMDLRRIEHKWAGLRSFVTDGEPVAGYAPDSEGFFWLAGQGGYGIQSVPALARSAAALIRNRPLPGDVLDEGASVAALSPSRASLARGDGPE